MTSSFAFWWQASNEHYLFLEANEEYVNNMISGGETYERFAKKTNEALALLYNVDGSIKHLSKEQRKEVESILNEAQKLNAETGLLLENNPAKTMFLRTRLSKYDTAKNLSISGVVFGFLISGVGFYFWHVRLQKHIDKSHES